MICSLHFIHHRLLYCGTRKMEVNYGRKRMEKCCSHFLLIHLIPADWHSLDRIVCYLLMTFHYRKCHQVMGRNSTCRVQVARSLGQSVTPTAMTSCQKNVLQSLQFVA